MKGVTKLLELLELEKIEYNLYRGLSSDIGSSRVFGGQVLAQALMAASKTVPEDRHVHSLHAYFILPGDISIPIIFEVDRIRDGGSFTTRRVIAIQRGRAIFNMSASFQLRQEGFSHQIDMPDAPPPEKLLNWKELAQKYGDVMPDNFKRFLLIDRPIEFRPVEPFNHASPEKQRPFKCVWMKARGTMPDNPTAHRCVLAYASDYHLLTTALLPHGRKASFGNVQLASLDHAMWFHRDLRANQWLLYAIESPSTSNARGFTRGNIFSKEGKLVASVAQEGLIRPKKG